MSQIIKTTIKKIVKRYETVPDTDQKTLVGLEFYSKTISKIVKPKKVKAMES